MVFVLFMNWICKVSLTWRNIFCLDRRLCDHHLTFHPSSASVWSILPHRPPLRRFAFGASGEESDSRACCLVCGFFFLAIEYLDKLFSKLRIQEVVDNEVVRGAREEEAP